MNDEVSYYNFLRIPIFANLEETNKLMQINRNKKEQLTIFRCSGHRKTEQFT